MTIEYYVGIAVGIGCVLIAYVISKLVKKSKPLCNNCKHLNRQDWNGAYHCEYRFSKHFFSPKFCSAYEEREDEDERA